MLPDPTKKKKKKKRFIIYYNKFKSSKLIIFNNSPPTPLNFLIGQTLYICSNVPWETVSPMKITPTLVLQLQLFQDMMPLNDSSSIALHLKTHSIPKSKFRKILVENTTIIAYEINRL